MRDAIRGYVNWICSAAHMRACFTHAHTRSRSTISFASLNFSRVGFVCKLKVVYVYSVKDFPVRAPRRAHTHMLRRKSNYVIRYWFECVWVCVFAARKKLQIRRLCSVFNVHASYMSFGSWQPGKTNSDLHVRRRICEICAPKEPPPPCKTRSRADVIDTIKKAMRCKWMLIRKVEKEGKLKEKKIRNLIFARLGYVVRRTRTCYA